MSVGGLLLDLIVLINCLVRFVKCVGLVSGS